MVEETVGLSLNDGNTLLMLVGLILCALVVIQWMQLRRVNQRLRKLLAITPDGQLDRVLMDIDERIRDLVHEQSVTRRRLTDMNDLQNGSISKVGLVRFDAFDAGGDLSFCIALLNGLGDGVVLTSIYARDESRIYAKPIQKYQSRFMLTQEEKEAIRIAEEGSSQALVAAAAEKQQ